MRKIFMLTLGDIKNITRDTMLLMMLFAPILLSFIMKYGLPILADILLEKTAFNLPVHYPFILSEVILLIPMLSGMLVGFMILDERDEKLLSYIAVTPVSKAGYLRYRIFLPILLSFCFSFLTVKIIGLITLNYLHLIPVFLVSSLEAPMVALFLGAFAANKIEGLALSKACGFILIAPIAGYLLELPWQFIVSIFPPYWVSKAFMAAGKGGYPLTIYIIIGAILHLGVIYLLFRRFDQKEM